MSDSTNSPKNTRARKSIAASKNISAHANDKAIEESKLCLQDREHEVVSDFPNTSSEYTVLADDSTEILMAITEEKETTTEVSEVVTEDKEKVKVENLTVTQEKVTVSEENLTVEEIIQTGPQEVKSTDIAVSEDIPIVDNSVEKIDGSPQKRKASEQLTKESVKKEEEKQTAFSSFATVNPFQAAVAKIGSSNGFGSSSGFGSGNGYSSSSGFGSTTTIFGSCSGFGTVNSDLKPLGSSGSTPLSEISSKQSGKKVDVLGGISEGVLNGEEDEKLTCQVRAKLFKLKGSNEWVEMGIGPVRVLESKKTLAARMVMRQEYAPHGPGFKVILNIAMAGKVHKADRDVRLVTFNEESQSITYLLRVKESVEAGRLYSSILDGIERMSKSG